MLVDEVHVPRRTTELAVGHRLEPGVLLQAYDVGDRGVLGGRQLLVGDLALGMRRTGLEQRLGPQQAADVVGSERRCGAQGHGSPSLGDGPRQSNTAAQRMPRVSAAPDRSDVLAVAAAEDAW